MRKSRAARERELEEKLPVHSKKRLLKPLGFGGLNRSSLFHSFWATMMFRVVLYEPKIPPNTGNIIRLCANTGADLHLIAPLGFVLDDAKLRRAGLDYREFARVRVHAALDDFLKSEKPPRLFACSKFANRDYSQVSFQLGDALLFGSETEGLPATLRDTLSADQLLRIPMLPENRSLNLSNAVAVVLYEAWRQNRFEGTKGGTQHF